MRNHKKLVLGVGVGTLALGLLAVIVFSVYSGSNESRASLLVEYFRALSAEDTVAVAGLTSPDFQSDLVPGTLVRGTYKLYDFGEADEGTLRFVLVAPAPDGRERAILGEMDFRQVGISNRIDSIRWIDEGKRLTE